MHPLLLLLVVLLNSEAADIHDGLEEKILKVSAGIVRDPERAELYLLRADLHRRHRDWEMAHADLERAEALDGRLPGLDLMRGRTFLDQGRLAEAGRSLARASAAEPGNGRVLLARAGLRERQGDLAAAEGDLDRALDLLDPPQPEHFLERARVVAERGPDHRGRAVEGLDQGIARLGPTPSLVLAALALERDLGRFDAALRRVEVLSTQGRRKERWQALQGEVLLQAGRPAEARAAFEAALASIRALSPRHRRTRAVLDLEARVAGQLAALTNAP